MISQPVSRFFRGFLSFLLVAGFALLIPTIHAQDYSEEEYSQYQSIEAETDSGKKTDMTIQFFADNVGNCEVGCVEGFVCFFRYCSVRDFEFRIKAG
ncbi:MAG: hypothetical protein P8Y80_03745 [Acidobacteriota bacterium]